MNKKSETKSWFSRAKAAIAAFALVGAVIAGSAAISDAPDTDAQDTEVAWSYQSYTSYSRSTTWR